MEITEQQILNFIFNPDPEILFYLTIGIGVAVLTVAIIEGPGNGPLPKLSKKRKNFSDTVKLRVLKAQNHKCKACKKLLTTTEFDHIDGNRENNCGSNCQALCPNCHAEKTRTKLVNHKTGFQN